MKYNFFKLIHITGIVTWLGPSTGGFILIYLSQSSEQSAIELWLRQEYLSLVHIETAGLIIIILSGLGMLYSSAATLRAKSWIKIKGYIILTVFLPLELIQLYLYQGSLKTAFASGQGLREAISLFDTFSVIAFVLLAITVPVVFIMGIFKPDWSNKRRDTCRQN
jgi:uncharacterized membrane protein